MDLRQLHADLVAAARQELDRAITLRHDLHRRPERSGHESWTTARITRDLPCAMAPVAATGAIGRVGPQGAGIALRVELDGLPLREDTGSDFAATDGMMHACGHDVHCAALAAVARAGRRVGLPAAMICLLQPREETAPSGARDVVREKVLSVWGARAVVAVHLQPQLPRGTVAADPGIVNAASDEIDLTIVGQGGHGGYPHLSRDPVPALCQAVLTVEQTLRSQVDPMHPAAISIGALRAGDAANVIAGTAHARGTLRTFAAADREALHQAIRDAVEATATAYGCRGTVEITAVEPPLDNDPALATAARRWLARSGFRVVPEFRSCGSDDFSFYGQALPSQMVFLGLGPGVPALHSPEFLAGDDLVEDAAVALIACYVAAVDSLPGSLPDHRPH